MSWNTNSRRAFLSLCGAAPLILPFPKAIAAALAKDNIVASGNGHRPTVGMIVPPAPDVVPPEVLEMYPTGYNFIARGLALEELPTAGYSSVIDRCGQLAKDMVAQGADAVVLMGTSLSFFRGVAFDQQLIRTMRDAGGVPATTMSSAVVDGLNALGAKKVAVATAYIDEVNRTLVSYLGESGFDVQALRALKIVEVARITHVTPEQIMAVGEEAVEASPKADALLISCGGLHTLDVISRLEQKIGIPVVTSATTGAWAAVRLVGGNGYVAGHGRLLSCGEDCRAGK